MFTFLAIIMVTNKYTLYYVSFLVRLCVITVSVSRARRRGSGHRYDSETVAGGHIHIHWMQHVSICWLADIKQCDEPMPYAVHIMHFTIDQYIYNVLASDCRPLFDKYDEVLLSLSRKPRNNNAMFV